MICMPSICLITRRVAHLCRVPQVSRFRDLGVGALHQFIGLPTIFNLTYNFNLGNGDNGNVMQIVNGRDSNRTQNFVYDSLNRVSQAYSSGPNWRETYGPTALSPGTQPATPGIDPWGNLTSRSGVTGKNTYEALTTTATAKNQLSGFGYDAAGNLNQNGAAIYDAENRILSTVGYTYIYDGDGRRVEKCITPNQQNPASCNGAPAGNGTLYWLDNSLAGLESDLGWNWTALYAKFNGKRLARMDWPSNNVHFYLTDELGSADVIADEAGDIQKESDYYPYGGEIVISGSDPNKFKFTGKERDSESGLDMFGARYYASSMGRFMIPDPKMISRQRMRDPQQWNMYQYGRNNPITMIDPDGREVMVAQELQKSYDHLMKSESFRNAIAPYQGKGNPDLNIQRGKLGNDPMEPNRHDLGLTKTTIVPSIQNCSSATSCTTIPATLKSATVTIDDSVKDGKSKDQTEGVMAHEVSHANDAVTNPQGYLDENAREANKPHDDRSEEKRADQFSNDVRQEVKREDKQEKKDKKDNPD